MNLFGEFAKRRNASMDACLLRKCNQMVQSLLWGTTKDTMEKNAPATKCTRTSTSEQDDGGPAFAPNRVPALAVDPPAAILPFAGGICTLMLINVSSVRLAFKMRCSNNCHYRLRPVYGFVEAASMTPFEIIR
uniref:Major sperm protein n=1 Tax=Parascaris equorum TaxID=6256 RepID=A0A914S8W5_PAREQ